jgi:ATP-dependent Clp protease ATP-binding subunit ClpX
MQELVTTIGAVFDRVATLENHQFQLDQEFFQRTPIEIQNEDGEWCSVRGLIIKQDRIRRLAWSDGSVTRCADQHWIRTHGDHCRLAASFEVGDEIERADGVLLLCMENILTDAVETVYDLQIDTPSHLYQTADGVVHHNTLLAQSIARMLDVPIVSYDATSLTESGYVGADIEDTIGRLLQAADYDVKRAERGIVFLDEIDKKAKREATGTTTRDVAGEGVQQGLLKLLEGTEIMVPASGRKGPNAELVKINTRNILFILAGAFVGLDKLVAKELQGERGIGFGANVVHGVSEMRDCLSKVEPDHLIKYGLIPELVGRVPVISVLQDLDEDQLVEVLTKPKNAIVKQYVKMFSLDGVALSFDDEALREVAKIAYRGKTNARALRGVLETSLLRTQFQLPELRDAGAEQIIVHLETISNGTPPEVVYKPKKQAASVAAHTAAGAV